MVFAGIDDFTVNGEGPLFLRVFERGDEDDVLVVQRYVGHVALQDAVDVERDDLKGSVGFAAVHDGAREECVLGDAVDVLK